jgi:hypothetical protein
LEQPKNIWRFWMVFIGKSSNQMGDFNDNTFHTFVETGG